MFNAINKMKGRVLLELCGAVPEEFLNECARQSLPVISAVRTDAFCLRATIPSAFLAEAETAAQMSCCSLRVIGRKGLSESRRRIARRIFPAALSIILLLLLYCSRFYVWRIELSGNETVAAGEILDALDACGVECGAFWPAFSPENLRAEVLRRIPELSWVQVNVHGSVAEVSVRERRPVPDMNCEGEPADIIAACDGFVRKLTVLAGQGKTDPGSAVGKGEVLVSGIVESSFSPPEAVRALGSVEAEVNSSLTAVMPVYESQKRENGKTREKFSLIVGNNRINFYSGSSISDALCDKIISVWKIGLDGVFSLPLAIVRERELCYTEDVVSSEGPEAGDALGAALYSSLPGGVELISDKLSFSSLPQLHTASLRVRWIGEIGVSAPIDGERIARAEEEYLMKADDNIWQNE